MAMSRQGRKDTLSSDDMKLLFQLQVWNRELRSELDLADGDVPQVDLQTDEFVEQLRQAALEGHLLSEELVSLEQEISQTAVHLTEAGRAGSTVIWRRRLKNQSTFLKIRKGAVRISWRKSRR
ncbi:unnamed protein product [Durusdinium trenchii]|uniref:Uncharacterized protein n=1 Tax=Durusdinium trenchii TaxID=1381693 RepID=A0ABP0NWT7_9DINO